jgi:hypothetical protein
MSRKDTFSTTTVKYKYEDEPIVIEISPVPPTMGKYRVAVLEGTKHTVVGSGDITDELADSHQVPVNPLDLRDKSLFIIGEYHLPANISEGAVAVNYRFKQKGVPLDGEIAISEKAAGVVHTNHVIKFEP